VCQVFVAFHPGVAHLQHIRIIPMTRTGKPLQAILTEAEDRHAVVVVADVSRCAPQISGMRTPQPGGLYTPVTDTEHDRPSRLCECVSKLGILDLGIETFGVIPIDFDVVNAPSCIGFRILNFVIQTPGAVNVAYIASMYFSLPPVTNLGVLALGKRCRNATAFWVKCGHQEL
jgi:hypothetical protein